MADGQVPSAPLSMLELAADLAAELAAKADRANSLARDTPLINSNFALDQREGAPYSATGYTLDRWRLQVGTGATVSIDQVAGLRETSEFAVAFSRTVAGSGTSIIEQRIEDVRKLSGKRVAVTFDYIGDATIAFNVDLVQNFGSGGSAAVSTTDNVVNATTTLQRATLVIDVPSVSGKTIGAGSYTSLRLFRLSGQANGAITIGDVDFRIIPDDLDSPAISYSPPDPSLELLRARRYFERIGFNQSGVKYVSTGYASTTSQMVAVVPFQEKRVAPTISSSSAGGFALLHAPLVGQTATLLSFANTDVASTRLTMNVSGTPLTVGEAVLFRVNSAAAFIDLDAEL